MGAIAGMIQNIRDEDTPLQKKLDGLGRLIVAGCMIICAAVSVIGIMRGEDRFEMLLTGISLAVAAVPEGLPAVVTIALATGVSRMMRRGALVRRLPSVETLGCANVICSDKTGTLTENKMTIRSVYAAETFYDVTGSGLTVEGEFQKDGRKADIDSEPVLKLMLEIGAVCNNSRLERVAAVRGRRGAGSYAPYSKPQKNVKRGKILQFSRKKSKDSFNLIGDPTEGAFLVAAEKAGISTDGLTGKYTRTFEIPFDSDRKLMSVIARTPGNEKYVFVKGAPDVVIKKCSKLYTLKGVIDFSSPIKSGILRINDMMAGGALRVLAVACKKTEVTAARSYRFEAESSHGHKNEIEKLEDGLVFVGLAGMIDPPRQGVRDAITRCRTAGIKVAMITGDHRSTAVAVANELGLMRDGSITLTGQDLDRMDGDEFLKLAPKAAVYARVSPRHKLQIVQTLKKLNNVVAMTGDGVNDAPAVKEADIGVSMGISGTDVTKEASAMILTDDNFNTVVAAVEEGRLIHNNIRKFIRYLLSCNLGEVLTMFAAMVFNLPAPLAAIQILLVNLVTDGLPAVALGIDPPDRDLMKEAPRKAGDGIFSGGLLKKITVRGFIIGAGTLAVFISVFHFTADLVLSRTSALMTLILSQLVHVFECKSEKKNIFQIDLLSNKHLIFAVLISFAISLLVVYEPHLAAIFSTERLGAGEWKLIAGYVAAGPVISSIFHREKKV
jgi:Ca2+-transporting ATPase